MKIKKQSNRLFAFLMTLVLIFGSVQMPQMVYAEEPAEAITVEDEQAVVEEPAVVEDSEEAQTTDEQAVTEPEIVEEAQETEPAEVLEAEEPIEIASPVAEDELNVDQAAIDIELEEEEDLVAADGNSIYKFHYDYTDPDNEENHILYTDSPLTISVVKEDGHSEAPTPTKNNIEWHITQWNEELNDGNGDDEDDNGRTVTYKVNNDGSITITAKEDREFEGVDVWAVIKGNDEYYVDQYRYVNIEDPRVDTPCDDWTGLPEWTYNIENSGEVYISNKNHPGGENIPYTIVDVEIGGDGNFVLDERKDGDKWVLRAKNYGKSIVTITYQFDGEDTVRTQEVCINAVETVFLIDADSVNRCCEMLPGESLTINASMRKETCFPQLEEDKETQATDDEGNLCWNYETTDQETLEKDGYSLTYTVRDNETDNANYFTVTGTSASLTVKAPDYTENYDYRWAGIVYEVKKGNESFGDYDLGFNVCNDYYEIELDNDVDTDLLVDETQDITPTLKHHYMKDNGNTITAEVEKVNTAVFEWEHNEDDITIKENAGTYTLTRKSNEDINIELCAYVPGSDEAVRVLDWRFDGLNYNVWLDFSYYNGNRVFKDGGSLTVSLKTDKNSTIEKLIKEKRADIVWHYTHYVEPANGGEDGEDVDATDDLIIAKESVDKKSVGISYNQSSTTVSYNGIDVWATVEMNGKEIARADNDRYIEICDPNWAGYEYENFWNCLYGDEYFINKSFDVNRIDDGNYPKGIRNASIVVKSVTANDSYTDEWGTASKPNHIKITKEDDGWIIHAKDGGYVRVEIQFEIQYDQKHKSKTHTRGMNIYVGNEVQSIWMEIDTPCILPGETRTFDLQANVTKLLTEGEPLYDDFEIGENDEYLCEEYEYEGTTYKKVIIENLEKLKELGYSFEVKNHYTSYITVDLDNDNNKISITAEDVPAEEAVNYYRNTDFDIILNFEGDEWHRQNFNIEVVDHYHVLTNKETITEADCFIGVGGVLTVVPILTRYDLDNREGIVVTPDAYEWENAGEDRGNIMVVDGKDGSYKVVRKSSGFEWGALWAVFHPEDENGEDDRVANYGVHLYNIKSDECIHGYTETKNAKDATCTVAGYTGDVHCLFCEDILDKDETIVTPGKAIPAKGHTWDAGKVTKAATETTTGIKTFTCTVCKETKTESIPVLPKTETSYSKPQTSTSKVTIPDVIDGCKVTSIDPNAFKNDKKLTQVTIGNNVTTIGSGAFNGCKELTKATLGKNVEVIGDNAFSGCKKLKTVKLGENVTTIGKNAFSKCEKLTKITIPKNVEKIGANAFKGCKGLKTVTISSSKLKKSDLKALKSLGKNVTIKLPKDKKAKANYKKWLKGFKGRIK